MITELIIRIDDLPGLPGARGSGERRDAAVQALRTEYRVFEKVGKLDVRVDGDLAHITLSTDDSASPLKTAVEALRAGRRDEGVALLKFLNACSPGDADILFFLGSALSDAGDLEHAEAYLRRATDSRQEFPEALINLGVVLSRMRKHREAIPILERALGLAPQNPYAHRNLAACLAGTGQDLGAAEGHFQAALKLLPDDPQTLLGLAGVYYQQGKGAAARSTCQKVLERHPATPFAEHARSLLSAL